MQKRREQSRPARRAGRVCAGAQAVGVTGCSRRRPGPPSGPCVRGRRGVRPRGPASPLVANGRARLVWAVGPAFMFSRACRASMQGVGSSPERHSAGCWEASVIRLGSRRMMGADELREIERERLRALLRGDIPAAREVHADDFQLIDPVGRSALRVDVFRSHLLRIIQIQRVGARVDSRAATERLERATDAGDFGECGEALSDLFDAVIVHRTHAVGDRGGVEFVDAASLEGECADLVGDRHDFV